MTQQKNLKRLIRARMEKTGESYATARRQVIRTAPKPTADPAARWHFPGNVPATTALRVLLAHAGMRNPHTGEPFSEPMLFGIAGGIGIGVFSFFYEKANLATFFVAGRHDWQDDLIYLRNAFERFALKPVVRESSGTKTADAHLREALSAGPCVAWVDLAHLPHRAVPAVHSGGGYHVVTVYKVDDSNGTATIGDLTDQPIDIPLDNLAEARARIKKQKNRLLSVAGPAKAPDVRRLIREGLAACVQRFKSPSMKVARGNFQLDALKTWAERLHGSKDRECWERVFAPGANLWRGLTGIYGYIEYYGTGGGLCRPLFADFFTEAAAVLKDRRLTALADRYADLGGKWTELADAALPDSVPMFREAKTLIARKAELLVSDGPPGAEEIRGIWDQLGELTRQAADRFPLSNAECAELRADLKTRVLALYAGEIAALKAVAEFV
jgi:Domain of unknown function (DUF4872)/Butirosin biosynthesis protein H, N-terminal